MTNTLLPIPAKQLPETTRFLEWYETEKKKGLVDIKFCPGENAQSATVELFLAEVNQAIFAQPVDDSELL